MVAQTVAAQERTEAAVADRQRELDDAQQQIRVLTEDNESLKRQVNDSTHFRTRLLEAQNRAESLSQGSLSKHCLSRCCDTTMVCRCCAVRW